MSIPREQWRWFGHAGHLIVAQWCRFHLTTQVGDYLVSTVGEYWPDRAVRERYAAAEDEGWLAAHQHLPGDSFDAAYMKRFGFRTIGLYRTYETMVFRAGAPCAAPYCGCELPEIDGHERDFAGYGGAAEAARGHLALCEKWAAREHGHGEDAA